MRVIRHHNIIIYLLVRLTVIACESAAPAHVFATDIGATVSQWCQHMGARVFFDDELAGARNAFLAVGTGRVHVQDQNPLEADPKLS